jgi:serine/threonine protein kinase
MSQRSPQSQAQPPEVDGYLATECLGRGGYASVWLAWRVGAMGFQVPVALKVLSLEHAQNEAARRRFLAEARLLAQLHHPNLVEVIDAGVTAGQPYYAMSYVRGVSLARLLARQTRLLPLDACLFMAIRVASALHAAHTALDADGQPLGIVHRDVNPTNILVGLHGNLKVIDFGIATSALGPRETRVNVVKGNPRYLAPEQAFGLEADVRTDIYALALTLYEAMTGRAPLASKGRAQGLALAREPQMPPPSSHRPSVSAELDGVVMRALAREPEQRFQSMDALARALQACLVAVNPTFLPESLDRILSDAEIPSLQPPRQGTMRIQSPMGPAREEELPTAVFQRPPGTEDEAEPTQVDASTVPDV